MLDFSVAALSATGKIKDLGAYAGIASILGLAVLSVLYFAQARELKRLREWAGRAPERAAEMQERMQADADRRAVQGAGAAGPVTARKPATGPTTAAAAGAVAQAAATPPASATVPATASGSAAGPPAPAVPATGAPASAAPGAPGTAAVPLPVTAAAGTAAAAAAAAAGGAGAPAAGATASDATQAIPAVPAQPAVATPAPRPEPAVAQRVTTGLTGPGPLPPLRRPGVDPPAAGSGDGDGDGDGSSSTRTVVAVVAGGLAVVAVALVLITQVFGGGSSDKRSPATKAARTTSTASTTASTSAGTKPPKPATAQVVRADFTVSVLNSTQRNGAAREAADKLLSSGFKIGDVKQAVTQTAPITLIAYKAGSKRAALDVAGLLGVSAANVTAADSSTLVAGSQANVVVTLGADKVQ